MKIKKQITTVEEVEVEIQLPAYFKNDNEYYKVYSDKESIKGAAYDRVKIYSDGFGYCDHMIHDVSDKIQCTPIEKEEYEEVLIKFHESIKEKINLLKNENQLQAINQDQRIEGC